MYNIASQMFAIPLVLVLWAFVFYYLYERRNKLFAKISMEYRLQLAIEKYPATKIVKWRDALELRRLKGEIRGKQVVIQDFIKSRSILAPWWYSGLFFGLSPVRMTLLSINGKTEDIGEGGLTLQPGFANYGSIKTILESIR